MKSSYINKANSVNEIFGQPWWLDIICENQWDAFVIEDENGSILWPYHTKRIGPWSTVSIPQVTLFQGPYVLNTPQVDSWNQAFEFFGDFDEFHYQSRPHWTINRNWNLGSLSSKKRVHFELEPTKNWRTNYNKLTKRKLKNSQNYYRIKAVESLDGFFDLSKLSYNKQGVEVPYSKNTMKKLFSTCLKKSCTKILQSHTLDGKLAGCIWLVWDNTSVYYFLSGIDREIPNNSSIVGLIDFAIEFALKEQKLFNFYGSEVPGVARFMKGFGAKEVYSTYMYSQSPKGLKFIRKVKGWISG